MSDAPETNATQRELRVVHPDVKLTRAAAIGAVTFGTLLLLEVLALRNLPTLIVLVVVSAGTTALLLFRAVPKRSERGILLHKTPFVARTPAFAAMVAFIAYALVLAQIHNHTIDRLLKRSEAALAAFNSEENKLNRTDQTMVRISTKIKRQIDRDRRHLSPRDELTPAKAYIAQIEAFDRALKRAIRGRHQTLTITPLARLAVLTLPKRLQPNYASDLRNLRDTERVELRETSALNRLHPGFYVSLNALPRWFSGLGNFYVLAAQLLTGMIVALAFSTGRFHQRAAEQFIRLAMLFAVLGLAASVIGSLPAPHRGLQAFLLGYVAAGFAGALSVLLLLTSDLLGGASPDTA